MSRRLVIVLLLLLAVSCSRPHGTEGFKYKVIHIADGDTITVLDANNKSHRIRLQGIECARTRASRQTSASKNVAPDSLLAQLEAINRTSRVLALRSPGLEGKFRMPLPFPAQELLKAARSFLANATPLKADFIREELPADFLEQLTAAISDFETSITEANRTKGAKVSAHAAQDEHIGEGMSLLQQLDVVVRNKFSSDRAVLAEWASASHVERHSSSGKQPDNPPGPNPTPPPSNPSSGSSSES